MVIIFTLLAVAALLFSFIAFGTAQSVLHEIFAGIGVICFVLCMGFAGIIDSINHLTKLVKKNNFLHTQKIETSNNITDNTDQMSDNKTIPVVIGILLLILIISVASFFAYSGSTKTSLKNNNGSTIQQLINKGIVKSIDENTNRIIIDMDFWSNLTPETQKALIFNFAVYLKSKGLPERFEVISNHNILIATYTSSGVKIFE